MALATPEQILQDFPAILTFKHVIETDENGQVCFAVENFSAMRTRYNIDRQLSDEAALAAIQEKMNEADIPEPTAEERIASALEFQNLMMLPDEEE
jgi:hypothetical protein